MQRPKANPFYLGEWDGTCSECSTKRTVSHTVHLMTVTAEEGAKFRLVCNNCDAVSYRYRDHPPSGRASPLDAADP